MPQFGVCTSVDNAASVKAAGFDYVEESVQNLLQGLVSDAEWTGAARAGASPLPVPAANVYLPGKLKVTGPEVDMDALRSYVRTVFARAQQVGIRTIVFGSAGARNLPEGFARNTAEQQILEFIRMFAPIAQSNGVTVVAEPLNRGESNILNTVGEAMQYVREVDHPGFQCLVDSYHFWLEEEPLENLRKAMPWIKHVHLADKDGRVAPGDSGKSDYKPFFAVLKEGGYDGLISIESPAFKDVAAIGAKTLAYIKDEWARA